jgi:hypothetical protein
MNAHELWAVETVLALIHGDAMKNGFGAEVQLSVFEAP